MTAKKKICKWCGKPVFYDKNVKMYVFIREDGSRNYYCPRDKNEDRCQHIPGEERNG